MRDRIRQALQELQNYFGEDVFSNPALFKAGIKDFLPGSSNELARNLLNNAIGGMDVYNRLKTPQSGNISVDVLNRTREMVNNFGVTEINAQLIVECIAELLGYTPLTCEQECDYSAHYLASLIACEPGYYGNVYCRIGDFSNDPDAVSEFMSKLIDKYFELYFIPVNKKLESSEVEAGKLVISSIMLYLYYEAPPEEQNMFMVVELLNTGIIDEYSLLHDLPSVLDKLFIKLEESERSLNHPAIEHYNKYKSIVSGAALNVIIYSLIDCLRHFNINFSYDTFFNIINTNIKNLERIAKSCVSTIDEFTSHPNDYDVIEKKVLRAMENLFLAFIYYVYFDENSKTWKDNQSITSAFDFYTFIKTLNNIDINMLKNKNSASASYFNKATMLFPQSSKTDYYLKLGKFSYVIIFFSFYSVNVLNDIIDISNEVRTKESEIFRLLKKEYETLNG